MHRARALTAVVPLFLIAACGGAPPAAPTTATTTPPTTAPATPTAQTQTTSAVPASSSGLSPDAIKSLLASSDRTEPDRKTDTLRHPDQFLQFIGIAPGMHVADLGSGTGYTTELLARAVGPNGTVYSQNDPDLVKKFLDKPLTERLARPANKNVVREDRKFDDPLPADAKNNLDIVVDYIFYHDAVSIGTDRDKMNGAVLAALKPGGTYVIVDASAKNGDGVNDTKTLHRIDENVVKTEVLKSGFTFVSSADFLRNPSDTRDWNSSPGAAGGRRGTEDRFILKFQKPAK